MCLTRHLGTAEDVFCVPAVVAAAHSTPPKPNTPGYKTDIRHLQQDLSAKRGTNALQQRVSLEPPESAQTGTLQLSADASSAAAALYLVLHLRTLLAITISAWTILTASADSSYAVLTSA